MKKLGLADKLLIYSMLGAASFFVAAFFVVRYIIKYVSFAP
ncbi:hypothetical protein [Paenibacillus pini]|nr:hypothetical protein [Paenibacillus pini]